MGNTNSRKPKNKLLRAGFTKKDEQLNNLAGNTSTRSKNKQDVTSPNNGKKPVESVIPRPKQEKKSDGSKTHQRNESRRNAEFRLNRMKSVKRADKNDGVPKDLPEKLKNLSSRNNYIDVPTNFFGKKFPSNVQLMICFMLIFMTLVNFLIVLYLVDFFYGHTDFGG